LPLSPLISMFNISKELYEKLEFDRILALAQKECCGELGETYFQNLQPISSLSALEFQLKKVKELKLSLEKNDRFPFNYYYPIAEELKMLAIDGYVLSVESLQRINTILLVFRDLYRFFDKIRREVYPSLYSILAEVGYDDLLAKEITRVIDDDGNIRADASPELIKIRKAQQSKARELDGIYKRIIGEYRQKGWLAESAETLRNGRRVLAVPVEHKRKVRGIIHDESTTGRTAFIEPEAAIEVNNDVFDLEQEEKQEIHRILRALSAVLRPHVALLGAYEQVVADFDVVLAKAKIALRMKANMPQLVNAPHMGIKKGRHPLLYLKNKALGKETIPFNLELFAGNRVLLLSGPNAGGKSVLMKSVGILQLMLQSGFLVPVHELSEMGIFESIFAHIGDAQSLDDDLSTYSSHLQNMKFFLEKANAHTLVLIDEFGSGTDPKMGGAIAEAILKKLNELQVYGVVTTHYGNLKMFAYKNAGIINGCMNFDKENLKPSYQLTVGRPGSSYAFEIAGNVGLDRQVLKYAKQRIGENEHSVDTLLVELQQEKQQYDQLLKELTEKQTLLDKLIKQYDDQIHDLEIRRKKMKLEAKEQHLQQTAQSQQEIQRLLKELRQEQKQGYGQAEQSLEKARALNVQTREVQQQLAQEVSALSDDIYQKPTALEKNIEVGDFVRMRTGSATGKVVALDKKQAIVQMGEMNLNVKIKDLVPVGEPLVIRPEKSVNTDIQRSAHFDPKIDLRGLTVTDAQLRVQDFLDQALITSANLLRIVHGKGDGILRRMVKTKLREYKEVKKHYHPESFEGGDGVTIAELG
jgi:DNA mismatch repair protein MutS2